MKHDAYRDAGVDIEAASKTKKNITEMVRSTFRPEVLTDIGSFGGLFRADFGEYSKPVLVSSADGVGTKLKVAIRANRHNTIGADLVNHCCNDILVMGARPLFFLDYLAYAKHDDTVVRAVIEGVTTACRENECALLGGEMAELPDVYHHNEYDLAGVIVGIVDEDAIIDGTRTKPGDVILGLASSGLHTNGYTLARKLVFETAGLGIDDEVPGTGQSAADALLAVHKSYTSALLPLIDDNMVHAMAHITGGGFTGNINRTLPKNCDAAIQLGSWPIPPIFRFLTETGSLDNDECYQTFNMGIGLTVTVAEKDKAAAINKLRDAGETVSEIGRVIEGSGKVVLENNA
jgi:phosphoribosylformylglycinamidine cyclo-ligase